MREIKFRAWDSVIKEMVYCDNKHYWAFFNSPDSIGYGLYDRNDGHRVLSGEYNPPIMQYTGLKDKHGKEIYEGDIVNMVYDTNEERPHVIVYHINKFIAIHLSEYESWRHGEGNEIYFSNNGKTPNSYDAVVIGNIYEVKEAVK